MSQLKNDPFDVKIANLVFQYVEPSKRRGSVLHGKAQKLVVKAVDPSVLTAIAASGGPDNVSDPTVRSLITANAFEMFPAVLDYVYEALDLDKFEIKSIEAMYDKAEGVELSNFMADVNNAFAVITESLRRPFVGTPTDTQKTPEVPNEAVEEELTTEDTSSENGEQGPTSQSGSDSIG
jgi:hypothetical protein